MISIFRRMAKCGITFVTTHFFTTPEMEVVRVSGQLSTLKRKVLLCKKENNLGGRAICTNEELGSGSFATTFRGTARGQDVAIKITGLHYTKYAEAESALLQRLHHPNVCQVLDRFSAASDGLPVHHVMIMPLYTGGTLHSNIRRLCGDRSAQDRMIGGILLAIEYLTTAGIVHSDLRAENIMITGADEPVLIDFNNVFSIGTSWELKKLQIKFPKAPYAVARHYRPPSMLMCSGVWDPRGTMMWSFGTIVMEMAAGRHPFPGKDSLHTLTYIEQFVKDINGYAPEYMLSSSTTLGRDLKMLPRCHRRMVEIPPKYKWWRPGLHDAVMEMLLVWDDSDRATASEFKMELAKIRKIRGSSEECDGADAVSDP